MTDTPATGGPARTAPAERGRTVVADRAVRRIAERAATEADLSGRRARVTHGTAAVHGRRADVSVDVRLPYPAALAETGEDVRGRMAERVAELSGLTVRAATVRVQSLTADRPPAPQPPPDGDRPTGGRSRRPWSARRLPAALAALVGAAASGTLLHDVLSVHLADRRPASWRTGAVDWLATHGPGDTAVVAGGAVAAVLGAWLLCLALTPGLRGVLPMAPVPGRRRQRAVLERTAAAALVRDAASAVPGVTRVRVRCGRRRVRLRAHLAFGDRATARAALRATADAALAGLGLSRPLKARIALRTEPHWRPPGTDPVPAAPTAQHPPAQTGDAGPDSGSGRAGTPEPEPGARPTGATAPSGDETVAGPAAPDTPARGAAPPVTGAVEPTDVPSASAAAEGEGAGPAGYDAPLPHAPVRGTHRSGPGDPAPGTPGTPAEAGAGSPHGGDGPDAGVRPAGDPAPKAPHDPTTAKETDS